MPSHSGHLLARGKGKGTANAGKSLSQGTGVGRWMVCSANVSGKGREVLARPARYWYGFGGGQWQAQGDHGNVPGKRW